MVEAMANRLHVYDVDSTMYMDNAIRQVRPNAPASSNTRNVSIPAEALDQSLRALRAAKVVKNDSRITEIYERVAGAKPGTTEFDALSSDAIQTMSSGFHNPLNDAVLATAFLSEETKLDKINSREGTGTDPGDDSTTDDTPIDEPNHEEGTTGGDEPTEDSSNAPTIEEPAENDDKKRTMRPPRTTATTPELIVAPPARIRAATQTTTETSDGDPVATRPNRAPTISGSPQTALVVGTPWSFTPDAADPDGDALTFTIRNQPSWAQFDPENGRLWGIPHEAGRYGEISITVEDSYGASASLDTFTLQVDEPTLGTATVSWEAPTTRTDGSPLPSSELVGYRVYWGTDPNNLERMDEIDNQGVLSLHIANLEKGTWYLGTNP
jgi:hypothetical protein